MPLISTEALSPERPLPASIGHQVYCGLDNCITSEVFGHPDLQHQLSDSPETSLIYSFERELQGPYLEMMLRGFRVDGLARKAAADELREVMLEQQKALNELSLSVWDRPQLNPRSRDQLKDLFYGLMKLPEVFISMKGERKSSMNREALEKLSDYLYARPFVSLVLSIRALAKQIEVLETQIDGDQRFRTSYNIAGTETGRPSSSQSVWGTGGNEQNIAPSLRWVFCADPGFKLGQVDLEQVEARDVGWFCGCLFNDWSFLDACETGDFHTTNSRLIWKERAWTGQLTADRKLADETYYRDFTFRDMAKRGGHLTDYMGTACTMSRHLRIPLPMAEEFQARFCLGRSSGLKGPEIEPAYPCLPRWWQWTATQLQLEHLLVTPFGRRRHFFGRPGDDATLREAIAFQPQSTTADRMNLGLLRCWRRMPQIQMLAQGYDSITFQFQERGPSYEREILEEVLEHIRVLFRHPSGRLYEVPGEAKVGWNWGARVTPADQQRALLKGLRVPRLNEDGLVKWSPSKPDERSRTKPLERMIL